jgi:hypothetical protein
MTHTPPEKTGNPPQASAGDKQQLEKFRDLLRSQVAAAKATLAPWLEKSRGDRTKYIAMLELAFDHYLDIHDEAEALELIHLNFQSTVQRRKGPLQ